MPISDEEFRKTISESVAKLFGPTPTWNVAKLTGKPPEVSVTPDDINTTYDVYSTTVLLIIAKLATLHDQDLITTEQTDFIWSVVSSALRPTYQRIVDEILTITKR